MQDYQREFLRLAVERRALKFGEFELKSGRISPYFFNFGVFDRASDLATLGRCYAAAIREQQLSFDCLFGPAYKGIPLAVATALALQAEDGIDTPWCCNRKEAKDHGEGGNLIGAKPTGRVLIIDDVITAGTAITQAIGDIRQAGGKPSAALIALDRQERGSGKVSALAELQRTFGITVTAIVGLRDLIHWLSEQSEFAAFLPAIEAYQEAYGT